MKTLALKTLLFCILFLAVNSMLFGQSPCYSSEPKNLKDIIARFNPWENKIKPGIAYLHYLLDTDIDGYTFSSQTDKSMARIAPYLADFKRSKKNSCYIPESFSKLLSGGTESKLHYGIILPNPDKSIIVLFMMDDTESLGFAILDKNSLSVIQPWESFDLVLGTYIYDLDLKEDKFYTISYGGLMTGITSGSRVEYSITKDAVKILSNEKLSKKNPESYFFKIPALKNFDRDDHEAAVEFYDKIGFEENSVLLYKTPSGTNVLMRSIRKDNDNFAFDMAVLDNSGNIRGEWVNFYYFGGIASSETMMSFDSDFRFNADKISSHVKYSENGSLVSDKKREFQITADGIKEILPKIESSAAIIKNLNTINLPLKIGAGGRDQGIISGNDQFMTLGKTLSEGERKILLPRSNWGPYDRTDVFTDEGRFVLLKTNDGTTIVAAWESASLTRVLHLQVMDNQGNAIGEPLDFIVSGSTPNAMSGNSNGIEISMNGDITINLLAWVNDYNTGEALRDDKATRKMKITKNGIIRQ